MELSSSKMTVRQIIELKRSNMLHVNAEYQRGAVWKEAQQKRLIDSIMRSYPLPLIYFHYKVNEIAGMRNERLEIIDGQQRIDAIYRFGEGAFKLFDPIEDERQARFPNFLKNKPCPWAKANFLGLSPDLREKFLHTELLVVKVTTNDEDEARDLFIRLQSGLPLNAQEKRDAWPGGFTDLVLKLAGKREIVRYPGHDFFRRIIKNNSVDRGEVRQLCAQICMLVFERGSSGALVDLRTQDVDDYYYQHLDFDINDPRVERLTKVLNLTAETFLGAGLKLKGHEAIHIVLLIDSLMDDYTRGWQSQFLDAYSKFKTQAAVDKKNRSGEYWFEYGVLTQAQSAEARSIQRRHNFFVKKMFEHLKPVLRDPNRTFGGVEREIIYFQNNRLCATCSAAINWNDLDIHHVQEHQNGGQTSLDNAAPVHRHCHPRGEAAVAEFERKWRERPRTTGDQLLRELSSQSLNVEETESGGQAEALPRPGRTLSPNPQEWLSGIPELQSISDLTSWQRICDYLGIEVGRNSARRVLAKWLRENRPEWPAVP